MGGISTYEAGLVTLSLLIYHTGLRNFGHPSEHGVQNIITSTWQKNKSKGAVSNQ